MVTAEKLNEAIVNIVNERLLAATADTQDRWCSDSEKEVLEWAKVYSDVLRFFQNGQSSEACAIIKARTIDPRI